MRSNKWESAYKIEEIHEVRFDNSRNRMVVKSNALIQQARFNLSLLEQRILLFLISKIKPNDSGLDSYIFSFVDFCQACGLALEGTTYENIRDTLKRLSDKSIWIGIERDFDGKRYIGEALVRWVNDVELYKGSTSVVIKFHEKMLPYLFRLREKFTQYQLRNVLAMNSTYAAALYELLKSYEYLQRPIDFELDELKYRLGVDSVKSYAIYNNFKQKVLDIAMREINMYSDLTVEYTPTKTGRKVTRIIFAYRRKDSAEEVSAMYENQSLRFSHKEVPGQLSLEDLT